MKNTKHEPDLMAEFKENIAYTISFRRLNKIVLFTGFFFFILTIVNIPFLYNPELDTLTFELLGKPTM